MSFLTLMRSTMREGVIWEFGKSIASGYYTISARNDYVYSVQKVYRDKIPSDVVDSDLERYFANDFGIAPNYIGSTISDFPKTVAVMLRALDRGIVIRCKSNFASSDAVVIRISEGDVKTETTFDFLMYPRNDADNIFSGELIMLLQQCSAFGYSEACKNATKGGLHRAQFP